MDRPQQLSFVLLSMILSFFIGTIFSNHLETPHNLVLELDFTPPSFKQLSYNLNTVTEEQLCQVPTIGISTAKKILFYRKRKGNFNHVQELQEIPGIGKKRFEKIKKFFTLKNHY